MANDLIVVMPASRVAGTMPEYLDQLARAGVDYWVEDVSAAPWLPRGMWISEKIRFLRELVQRFQHYRYMVMTCAHDVTFYGDRDEVIEKIPQTFMLQGAEKNCYPEPALAALIPDLGPWRFANGGLQAGTPQTIAEWCFAVECQPDYQPAILDQGVLNNLLASRSPVCSIDHRTELFFCLFGGYEELIWQDGRAINTVYATRPNFLHANGKWDATEMFRKRDESNVQV